MRAQHETEVQGVTSRCKQKIEKLNQHVKFVREKEGEVSKLHHQVTEMQQRNKKLEEQLKEHQQNTQLNEQQLRNGYENKFLDLQNKLLERKRDYTEVLEQMDRRGNDHLADHKKILEELRKALEVAEETRVKELVKKHTSEMETLRATCEEELCSLRRDN